MKAITLTPPRGTLITLGQKKIETRSWRTDYRGPLAIHQGSNLKPIGGRRGLEEICGTQPFFDALYPIVLNHDRYCDRNLIADALPMGKIVAVCELRHIVPTGSIHQHTLIDWPLTDQERTFGDFAPGRYAWLLADIRALPEPIVCKGALGLWEPDTLTQLAIKRQEIALL